MANIRELKEIIEYTDSHQAILLRGPHGMGKSQILKNLFKQLGYDVVVLFLGQAADAGDIIGLPHKYQIEYDGNLHWVTDYAAPKWWPIDQTKPIVIILDEINRGKPEMMQCIQDLTLNHELNGRKLPEGSRIIAAMNPISDGYYQVEELDPSLMDRFNVYDFNPTEDEWLDWARDDGQVHEAVIGFIEKFKDRLDAPPPGQAKADDVHPSRRSWERVSVNLKKYPKLVENYNLLINQLSGMIGIGNSGEFVKYLKEYGSGLSSGVILTKWDEKVAKKISEMEVQQQIHMVVQVCIYLDTNLEQEEFRNNKVLVQKVINNLEKFITTIHAEAMARFFGQFKEDFQVKKKNWPKFIAVKCKSLGEKFTEVMSGK